MTEENIETKPVQVNIIGTKSSLVIDGEQESIPIQTILVDEDSEKGIMD